MHFSLCLPLHLPCHKFPGDIQLLKARGLNKSNSSLGINPVIERRTPMKILMPIFQPRDDNAS